MKNLKAKKKRLSMICGVALLVSALSPGRGLALVPIIEEEPLPLPIPTPLPDPSEILFPPEEPSASTTTISADPTSIVANGSSTSAITVQAKDANGNLLTAGGDTVTLATTAGTLSSVTDNANGTYSATLTSSTTSGTATVSGTINGGAIASTTVSFTPGPASASTAPPATESGTDQPVGVTPPKIDPPPVVLPGSVPALSGASPTSPDGPGVGVDELGLVAPWQNDLSGYLRTPGGRSTYRILEIMRSMGALPFTVARILAPFPVAGEATYSDDWGQPRYEPYLHSHEGADIFADQGTPVIASSAGTVELTTGGLLSGYQVKLVASDRTYYIYAHLEGFAPRLVDGMTVSPGQVLGFVGTSGNAAGGPPHLHFEIHPRGGPAVPPVPYLDRWLAEAWHAAEALAASPGRVLGLSLAVRAQKAASKPALREPVAPAGFQPVPAAAAASAWAPLLLAAFLWWMRRRRSLRVPPGGELR